MMKIQGVEFESISKYQIDIDLYQDSEIFYFNFIPIGMEIRKDDEGKISSYHFCKSYNDKNDMYKDAKELLQFLIKYITLVDKVYQNRLYPILKLFNDILIKIYGEDDLPITEFLEGEFEHTEIMISEKKIPKYFIPKNIPLNKDISEKMQKYLKDNHLNRDVFLNKAIRAYINNTPEYENIGVGRPIDNMGRIVIPSKIREALCIKDRDLFTFGIANNDYIILKKK